MAAIEQKEHAIARAADQAHRVASHRRAAMRPERQRRIAQRHLRRRRAATRFVAQLFPAVEIRAGQRHGVDEHRAVLAAAFLAVPFRFANPDANGRSPPVANDDEMIRRRHDGELRADGAKRGFDRRVVQLGQRCEQPLLEAAGGDQELQQRAARLARHLHGRG